MIMKELALKYGCNPNQKPSRIFRFQLNQADYSIIYNSDKLRTDTFIYHRHPFDFNTTDAVCLDKYLIGNR